MGRAGEQDDAEPSLAGYVVRIAEEAGAGVRTTTGGRLPGDAEDATMGYVLAWAVEHDQAHRAGQRRVARRAVLACLDSTRLVLGCYASIAPVRLQKVPIVLTLALLTRIRGA